MKKKKSVVLLSGGLDSSVVLSIAVKKFDVHCISFNYGQRHRRELTFAKKQVKLQKAKEHKIFKIDFFGGSSLTDDIDVPENRNVENIPDKIPITYVPARNTIFLSYALGFLRNGPFTQWTFYTMGLLHYGPFTQWAFTHWAFCTMGSMLGSLRLPEGPLRKKLVA